MPKFLADLACQLLADSTKCREPILAHSIKFMLIGLGYIDVLRRVERDYK